MYDESNLKFKEYKLFYIIFFSQFTKWEFVIRITLFSCES